MISDEAAIVDHLDVPEKDIEDLSLKSASDGDNSVFSDRADQPQPPRQSQSGDSSRPNEHSENESEELDDIELIFTTDETCRDLGLQEDLVSITETESWQHGGGTGSGQPVLLKYTKSADGEPLVCNGDKTSSVEEAVSSQNSSIDREESVDRFDESSSTRLNKMWSQCSVLVETDISKCGVLEDAESSTGSSLRHVARRNTLAAPPTAYRYIISNNPLRKHFILFDFYKLYFLNFHDMRSFLRIAFPLKQELFLISHTRLSLQSQIMNRRISLLSLQTYYPSRGSG